MKKFILELESYEELSELMEIEENIKENRFYTKYFDNCVTEFINIASNNSYNHSIIDNDSGLENYLSRQSNNIAIFRQGQDLKNFNADYFYINGYDNLEDLSNSRLSVEVYELTELVIDTLKEDISDYIIEHFEDNKEPLQLTSEKNILYNGLNYSIEDSKNIIIYGEKISDIIEVLIANLKVNIILDIHNKKEFI